MKFFAGFLLVLSLFFCVGCSGNVREPLPANREMVQPQEFGAGVYYFPAVKEAFANSLAEFLRQHPEMKVAAMAGNGTDGYGYDVGYFVVFEKR